MRGVVGAGGDRAVAQIARRQRGVVTFAQLLWAGLSEDAIAYRLSGGRLHALHRGVYLVGHRVAPPLARDLAAVFACNAGAVLSHESAASVWGIRPPRSGPVDVTVPGRDPGRPRGIRPHRTRTLTARDVTTRHGIPITAPARTLLDLAGSLSLHALERALEEAEVKRLVRRSDVDDVLSRANGRRGVTKLRRAAGRDGPAALTRSEAERRLLAVLRRAGIAPDETNGIAEGFEADMLWRDARLIAEIDGFETHGGRRAFERDRARDQRLIAAGYRVVRVTWRQIVHEPEAVVARMAQALAR